MNAPLFFAIIVAGGIGSILRYLADNALPARLRQRFPWGTALVNLTGSFLLGALVGAASHGVPGFWVDVLGIGVLGGFTTFSTASIETVRLALEGRKWLAVLNGFGMLLACVGLATLGLVLFGATS